MLTKDVVYHSYAFQTTIPGSQRRVDGRTTVAFRFVSARGPPRRRLLRASASALNQPSKDATVPSPSSCASPEAASYFVAANWLAFAGS